MVKRIAVIFLSVICLASCAASGSVEILRSVSEYDTDYSTVRAELIALSGLKDAEFEESVNSALRNELDSALVAFDTNARESSADVRMGNKCVFETAWEEKYNEKDFLSIVEERYIYMGGAHGETAWIAKNIDIAASKEVRLADLFTDSGYVTTLNRMIDEAVADGGEEYADLWEKPEIKDSSQTDFYISDGNLVIYYQPYDLSYYARGFVEFRLPLTELEGYLKEEYRRLV